MPSETNNPLVKEGVLAVFTKEKFDENQKIGLAEAAEYTREANKPAKIVEKFLETPSLIRKELKTGDVVLTHVPAGSYSPGSVQVFAARYEVVQGLPIELINGRIPTRTIYDFPDEAQREYFYQILACHKVIKQEFSGYAHGKYTVLFTENSANTVSDENTRVARTIAEPHTQIWIVNGHSKPFDPNKIPRLLRHERNVVRVLKNKIAAGMIALASDLAGLVEDKFDFKIRMAPPYGYVISTPINQEMSLGQQAEMLNILMKTHHERYKAESARLIEQLEVSRYQKLEEIIFPQPSYKVFGTFNDAGFLEISIAPSLFASAGVVESLNRQIYRDPKNVPFFESQNREDQYYGSVATELDLTQKFRQ